MNTKKVKNALCELLKVFIHYNAQNDTDNNPDYCSLSLSTPQKVHTIHLSKNALAALLFHLNSVAQGEQRCSDK